MALARFDPPSPQKGRERGGDAVGRRYGGRGKRAGSQRARMRFIEMRGIGRAREGRELAKVRGENRDEWKARRYERRCES